MAVHRIDCLLDWTRLLVAWSPGRLVSSKDYRSLAFSIELSSIWLQVAAMSLIYPILLAPTHTHTHTWPRCVCVSCLVSWAGSDFALFAFYSLVFLLLRFPFYFILFFFLALHSAAWGASTLAQRNLISKRTCFGVVLVALSLCIACKTSIKWSSRLIKLASWLFPALAVSVSLLSGVCMWSCLGLDF